jgi:cytochrome o ubiquinol oxidase subunit 2
VLKLQTVLKKLQPKVEKALHFISDEHEYSHRKHTLPYPVIFLILALVLIAAAVGFVVVVHHGTIAVLDPKGPIAGEERHLIYIALLLAIIVVIPVYSLLGLFAWRYKAGNKRVGKYSPDFDHSRIAETLWWTIPGVLILILSIITWNSSHQLDPYRPIVSTNKTMTVDVVSLDWKWLFIYPSQGIATVNYLELPVNTPVDFVITSDTVMNSFWIPQLGGQIYAMPGMTTQLNLMASSTGSFSGVSANISGAGFAGMNFMAHAVSPQTYTAWLAHVKTLRTKLNTTTYATLAKPSKNNKPAYYASVQSNLYDTIVLKYMTPQSPGSSTSNMQGMDMEGQ